MTKVLMLVLVCFLVCGCCEKREIRIACVGDSITEGMGIDRQCEFAYPAQLDSILGDGYEVMNLGRSSTTMMRGGDFPYWTAKEYTDVFRFHPDMVIIKLGTNDAKLFQWDAELYRESYQAMIDTFLTMTPVPEIVLCTPVPAQCTRWQITDSVISNYVCPIVKEIGERNGFKVIDLYAGIGMNSDLFVSDGIHPNKVGARRIAEIVAEAIR